MTWELFTEKKYAFGKPRITIMKSGGILINKSCIAEFIKDKKFLNLYYNPEKKLLGIKPINTGDAYSYKISDGARKTVIVISAISFFRKYKIDYEKLATRTFGAVWSDEEKLITISLGT